MYSPILEKETTQVDFSLIGAENLREAQAANSRGCWSSSVVSKQCLLGDHQARCPRAHVPGARIQNCRKLLCTDARHLPKQK